MLSQITKEAGQKNWLPNDTQDHESLQCTFPSSAAQTIMIIVSLSLFFSPPHILALDVILFVSISFQFSPWSVFLITPFSLSLLDFHVWFTITNLPFLVMLACVIIPAVYMDSVCWFWILSDEKHSYVICREDLLACNI